MLLQIDEFTLVNSKFISAIEPIRFHAIGDQWVPYTYNIYLNGVPCPIASNPEYNQRVLEFINSAPTILDD